MQPNQYHKKMYFYPYLKIEQQHRRFWSGQVVTCARFFVVGLQEVWFYCLIRKLFLYQRDEANDCRHVSYTWDCGMRVWFVWTESDSIIIPMPASVACAGQWRRTRVYGERGESPGGFFLKWRAGGRLGERLKWRRFFFFFEWVEYPRKRFTPGFQKQIGATVSIGGL